jgi:sporulation protein YlmC with PRC-barrel domain
MRRKLLTAGLAATAATLLANPAWGREVPAGEAKAQLLARDLLDRDVRSSDGVRIGDVRDLMLDPDTARVVSAVVAVDSDAGFDGRYLALPLEHLQLSGRERWLTADLTRDQFRTLPGLRYRD